MLDVVSAWVEGKDPRPLRDPAAARSYVAGVIVGDRLTSRLGISTVLTDRDVEGIVAESVVAEGTPWDPEAFGAAVRDVAATDGTLPSLMKLTREQLPHQHLALVRRQLGVPFLGAALGG
jgi:hypothetical protein